MAQAGASIYTVKEILEHANVRTIQRYAHQSPEYLGNQIQALDEFFKPGQRTDHKLETDEVENGFFYRLFV